jgi:hypothetical protein
MNTQQSRGFPIGLMTTFGKSVFVATARYLSGGGAAAGETGKGVES